MKITEQLLKTILVEPDLISKADFEQAKKEAKKRNEPLENILVEKGLVSDEEIGQLVSDRIEVPFINLRKQKINKAVLEIVPEIVAKSQLLIVFDKTKDGLKVAMADPEDLENREFIERKTGEKVIPYYATSADIQGTLKFYKKEIKVEFEELVGKTLEGLSEKPKTSQAMKLPIIKIVELILNYAHKNRASDIHIEPYNKKIILRYRIDGVLRDILTLPKFYNDFLVSRVKILSRLRTDIHEAPQDGHFSFSFPEERVDIRVSVVPIEEGEKVVLRLLSEKTRRFNLEDLGLEQEDLKVIDKNMKRAWGMILTSGPTGCGKTTTLYGMLKILNTREVNIMTIEDPIEYDVEGINQIQVNLKTKLTFSRGLRSIVRQDPDIIMVGEIRDEETAKMAVNSAMTGHLVLSTFHTNDAATAIPRLLDMDIESYLIASTLNVVIAQRLIRKICPKCIESYEIPYTKLAKLLGKDSIAKLQTSKAGKIQLFHGKGCPLCQKTGYLGRIGIFEVMEMTEPVKKLVMGKANAFQIKEEAIRGGMTTMTIDGLRKVERGITTIDEVLRVTRE